MGRGIAQARTALALASRLRALCPGIPRGKACQRGYRAVVSGRLTGDVDDMASRGYEGRSRVADGLTEVGRCRRMGCRAGQIVEQEFSGIEARSNVYESEYADRLRELREAASEDGYALREESNRSFIEFLCAAPYEVKRAGLALAGGGDVNAIWVSKDRTRRVSIQVFGDGATRNTLCCGRAARRKLIGFRLRFSGRKSPRGCVISWPHEGRGAAGGGQRWRRYAP